MLSAITHAPKITSRHNEYQHVSQNKNYTTWREKKPGDKIGGREEEEEGGCGGGKRAVNVREKEREQASGQGRDEMQRAPSIEQRPHYTMDSLPL